MTISKGIIEGIPTVFVRILIFEVSAIELLRRRNS